MSEELNDIGFFYQVYKEPKATLEALKGIRKHFPDAPVYLVSDNGYDYSKMAESFNCAYEHSQLSVGRCEGCKNINNVYSWLERIDRAIIHCQTRWIVKMEDDVEIRSKITRDFPIYACGGTLGKWNRPLSPEFIKACEEKTGKKVGYKFYGMCGGSIFRSDKFAKARSIGNYDVGECSKLDRRTVLYGDAILTAFFYMNGMQYLPWRELSEPWDACPTAAFHHPCKQHYGKDLTIEEQTKYLISIKKV